MVESMEVDFLGPSWRNGRCSKAKEVLAFGVQGKYSSQVPVSFMLGLCVVPLPSVAKEI
jgi:hypothetical protein